MINGDFYNFIVRRCYVFFSTRSLIVELFYNRQMMRLMTRTPRSVVCRRAGAKTIHWNFKRGVSELWCLATVAVLRIWHEINIHIVCIWHCH